MKKIILIAIVLFLGYNSFYFKKLSSFKNQANKNFDFKTYADSLYYKGILQSKMPIELAQLLAQIQVNPTAAFNEHGNRLGIGNSAYFMVKTMGKVVEIREGKIQILTYQNQKITIETQFIFGNAIRDASKLVKLTDFKTTAEFNQLSESLNEIIKEKMIPKVTQNIKIGDTISVLGALKLSKKTALPIEIIPANMNILTDSLKIKL